MGPRKAAPDPNWAAHRGWPRWRRSAGRSAALAVVGFPPGSWEAEGLGVCRLLGHVWDAQRFTANRSELLVQTFKGMPGRRPEGSTLVLASDFPSGLDDSLVPCEQVKSKLSTFIHTSCTRPFLCSASQSSTGLWPCRLPPPPAQPCSRLGGRHRAR